MEKTLPEAASGTAATTSAGAQGRFETYQMPNALLHVYYSNDVMGDASYIVESAGGLVTLETPLFKSALKEFNDYLAKLGKPVVAEIVDYHLGGTGDHAVIMVEGMGKFTKEGVYAAMMEGFQKGFGDAMVDLPTGEITEVPFGATRTLAGVTYSFNHGSSNDFPGAAILIDGTAYLTHWAPAKAHMNNLQLSGAAAVPQFLEGLEAARRSKASLFIGGHGGAADSETLDFRIRYVKTLGKLLAKDSDAASFAADLKAEYPELPGAEGIDALAEALYK